MGSYQDVLNKRLQSKTNVISEKEFLKSEELEKELEKEYSENEKI